MQSQVQQEVSLHSLSVSILDHTAWLAQAQSDRNENILNKTKTIL
jgi:hypothetical protein